MYVAFVQKPDNSVSHMQVRGSADPIPDEMFEKLSRRQGRELWCHYLVQNGAASQFMKYDPRVKRWSVQEPPATLVMAVELVK